MAEITLSLKPRYSVTQARYVNIGLDTFIDNFPEMLRVPQLSFQRPLD